jgi:hypothetical protein
MRSSSLRSTEEDNSDLTEEDIEWLRRLGSFEEVHCPIYLGNGVYGTRFIKQVWRKGEVKWVIEDWPA